jgi:hypothetical protein
MRQSPEGATQVAPSTIGPTAIAGLAFYVQSKNEGKLAKEADAKADATTWSERWR